MKKHLYKLLFVLPLIGFGQGWEVTFGEYGFGSSIGRSVNQTIDGGYIVGGTLQLDWEDTDCYLIKTDENGVEEWSQSYGNNIDNEEGNSVQQTIDGGYILCGSINNSDIYLIKTDENGVEEWSQIYGDDSEQMGYSVQQTLDGGYIIAGHSESGLESWDVWVIKTNENGIEEWSQIFEGDGGAQDRCYDIQQTEDEGYIITGSSWTSVGYYEDILLLKIDENGEEEWSQTFGDEGLDKGCSVQQTLEGGYILVGEIGIGNGVDETDIHLDVYLIKTDENGEEEWSQTFGTFGHDGGSSVQQTTDGGFIITGYTTFLGGGYVGNLYLIKTDENGEEEWFQTFDDDSIDTYSGDEFDQQVGFDVEQTIDGGYIVVGNSEDYIYLIKTDGQGNITSTIELPTPTSKRELIKTTNILGQENTTIKNQPMIEIYDDGSTEKKIVLE